MPMDEETGTAARIDVECHIIRAAVSVCKISYRLPVILHAEAAGEKGVTAESLSAELFPGLLPLSRRMLDICERDGLVRTAEGDQATNPSADGLGGRPQQTPRYHITEEGREAIASEKTFVRNTGQMHKIYHVDDERIPKEYRIVWIGAGSYDAGYDKKNTDDHKLEPVPDSITEIQGAVLTRASGGDYAEFRVEDIWETGKRIINHGMSAELRVCGKGNASSRVLITLLHGKEKGRVELQCGRGEGDQDED